MPTIEQIRAARALLGWSQSDLADHADLSQTGIARIENGTNNPNSTTLEKITSAFDRADIEFLGTSGLRKRSDEVKILRGREGFVEFMNDVYETAKKVGGEICLFNAKPSNWYKWLGEDWYQAHAKRMRELQNNFEFKATVCEGEQLLIGQSFGEYRWFPKEMYNEQSFYAYGDKIGFLQFKDDNLKIVVLSSHDFTEGFKALFNIAWDSVAKRPSD